jgi:5-amino-6-(5-phosphoribosylamino)uracil reductase
MANPSALSTTVVLGMTVDGKISATDPHAARTTDAADQAHLEYQVSLADLILVGAGTIRAEGSTFTVRNPELLAARTVRGQSPQPITCVVSRSLELSVDLPFFSQNVERWILTTRASIERNQQPTLSSLARLVELGETDLNWDQAYTLLEKHGVRKIAALGGGDLTAALLEADRVDDLWLTVWPVIYGGRDAPSPVEGKGFIPSSAPSLQLIESRQVGNELFLHYQVLR